MGMDVGVQGARGARQRPRRGRSIAGVAALLGSDVSAGVGGPCTLQKLRIGRVRTLCPYLVRGVGDVVGGRRYTTCTSIVPYPAKRQERAHMVRRWILGGNGAARREAASKSEEHSSLSL